MGRLTLSFIAARFVSPLPDAQLIVYDVHRCNILGYRGTGTPHFLDCGYHTPTFQDTVEEFAVNRGDQPGLNFTKTISAGVLPSLRP